MEGISKGNADPVKLGLKPVIAHGFSQVISFIYRMLKYLFLLLTLTLAPVMTQAQTNYAVVDYVALTDSLYGKFAAQAFVDSVYAYQWSNANAMVEKYQDIMLHHVEIVCHSKESIAAAEKGLRNLQETLEKYDKNIFQTAIPALDSSLHTYLENLIPQALRAYKAERPALKFFDAKSVLYHQPNIPNLTRELLAYIETQRGYQKRFTLYANSIVVSLGLSAQ